MLPYKYILMLYLIHVARSSFRFINVMLRVTLKLYRNYIYYSCTEIISIYIYMYSYIYGSSILFHQQYIF